MDEVKRFETVKAEITKLSGDVIRIEERHKSSREKLEKLLKTITEKGYDPTKLAEIRATQAAELKKSLDELETKVKEIKEKLNTIEAGQ
jgi:hypothetical protein